MALQAAIDAIDALVLKLQSGQLNAAGSPAPQPARPSAAPPAAAPPAAVPAAKSGKPTKAKPEKPAKAATPAPAAALDPATEQFQKAQLVVAKVLSVEPHPSSEKLYKCRIDIGSGKERQVIAGLRKHVPAEELQGSHVCVVLNLKPAKLAGELSEAMILAASVKQGEDETVRVLVPAEGAEAGEAVLLEGAAAPAEYPKTLKVWSKIVEQLAVAGERACYAGRPLVSAAGPVTAVGMPDGAEIH